MSALTKIAVVLLVIASLLLSAGVVVFVNKVEHFNDLATATQGKYDKEIAYNKDLRMQVDSVNALILKTQGDSTRSIDQLKQDVTTKENANLELKNQNAKLETDKKVIEVALANMTKVQEGLQGQLAGSQAQITDLRANLAKTTDERHSVNTQLTDALSKVEALEKARRNAEERAAGLRVSLDDLERKVAAAGFKPDTLPRRSNEGTPVLEGVVSSVFPAGGKPWASITIGAKDNVTKGMKFHVVNNNEFLGYLTIQTTEPNEAAGVLDGPAVEKVHTGDQVKTQLQ